MVEHSTIFVPDVSYQDTLIVQSVYSCGIYCFFSTICICSVTMSTAESQPSLGECKNLEFVSIAILLMIRIKATCLQELHAQSAPGRQLI